MSNTSFQHYLQQHNIDLKRSELNTLQINIGKFCNLACSHCHVGAGPNKKKENMDQKTAHRVIELILDSPNLRCVDITGGAPELNPHFREIIQKVKQPKREIIDRCNLTVLFEKGQEDTADFLAEHNVTIVASLPCYELENVEKQRGVGVFSQSVQALQQLNKLGYGKNKDHLQLNLVYNPVGPYLPPEQQKLEKDYKKKLKDAFNIEFNKLFCITNMPIKRFLVDLKREKKYQEYMNTLRQSFNPNAVDMVMCRSLVSLDWKGDLFDCDFNQALNLRLAGEKLSIWNIKKLSDLTNKKIIYNNHCFACTAGSGSSCTGAVA